MIANWLLISLDSRADLKQSPFFHVVDSREFVNLSLGERFTFQVSSKSGIKLFNLHHEHTSRIGGNFGGFKRSLYKYISSWYMLFDKYSRNRFLLSFFMLCFQDGFIFMLVNERSRWRHIKKYYLILNLKIECPLVLDFNYSVGVISKNKKLKGNVGFLFHVAFSNYFFPHADEVTSKLITS